MKAVVKGFCGKTSEVNCSAWGVDTEGWLVFRGVNGEVFHIIKSWDTLEIVGEFPLPPDDVFDAIDIKRGYCDT